MDARPQPEPLFTARFAGLWLFAFVTFFSAFQLLPAIPFRILELGGSKAAAGWFLSVYTYASAFAAPVMGSLADHLGRRRALVAASLLFIGFSLAYGLVTNFPLLLVIGAVHGAIWSTILASSSALMSDYIPESRRAQGLAWWGLAGNSAIAVAPPAGLWITHTYGWTALCIELAVLSALMAIGGTRLSETRPHRPETRLTLAEAWDWRVTLVALALGVIGFGYGGVTSYAAILSIERHITPASLYLTVAAIAVVFVRVFFSHLADRVGPKRILYPALAFAPVSFAVLAFAQQRWQLIVSAAIFGIVMGIAFPTFSSYILAHTDPRRRARTFGSIVWAFDTGIGTGSLAIGAIGQRFGLTAAFIAAAAISCLSIPIFSAGSRRLARGGPAA
ncbi:MAG TPA: MFS transporter [Thermoanaerobaculia bacterium]|nr:MFS transporter [Thermoanaerobaculia bacterium]